MVVAKANPDREMTVSEIANQTPFQAYSLDVHVRQLYSIGKLLRPSRGIYKLNKEYEEELKTESPSLDETQNKKIIQTSLC